MLICYISLIKNNRYMGLFERIFNAYRKQMKYLDIKDQVEGVIDRSNAFLDKDICKGAVVLIDGEVLEDHPGFEYVNFKLIPVYNEYVDTAIRKIIN